MNYYDPLPYMVPPEDDGILLRTVLQKRLGLSRKMLSRVKLTERGITVNGERKYITVQVQAGDLVEVRMEREESEDILPQEMPLHILHEDEHLLILNKPAGIIVHPTHGHYTGTLANGVVHYWQSMGETHRFRPIHRLDQETSGVLAVAKNGYVHQQISEQMIARQVTKEYVALVCGNVEADSGTIDGPIDRDPAQPHVRIVTPDGYSAVTHYAVERRLGEAALVRIRLETGRTHQIRVHMKHIGHPLVGDKIYLTEESERLSLKLQPDIGRQALHAGLLGFKHPGTRKPVVFTAPLPDDMNRAIARLLAKSETKTDF